MKKQEKDIRKAAEHISKAQKLIEGLTPKAEWWERDKLERIWKDCVSISNTLQLVIRRRR